MDIFDLVENASQQFFNISQAGIKKKATSIKELLKTATRMIERAWGMLSGGVLYQKSRFLSAREGTTIASKSEAHAYWVRKQKSTAKIKMIFFIFAPVTLFIGT